MTKNKYSLNILHNITKPISKFNECETFSPWKMLLLLSKFNMTKHYSSCHSSLQESAVWGLQSERQAKSLIPEQNRGTTHRQFHKSKWLRTKTPN